MAQTTEKAFGTYLEQMSGYVRMYSFLSQILPYSDQDLEKLYSYPPSCGKRCGR